MGVGVILTLSVQQKSTVHFCFVVPSDCKAPSPHNFPLPLLITEFIFLLAGQVNELPFCFTQVEHFSKQSELVLLSWQNVSQNELSSLDLCLD